MNLIKTVKILLFILNGLFTMIYLADSWLDLWRMLIRLKKFWEALRFMIRIRIRIFVYWGRKLHSWQRRSRWHRLV